MMSMTRFALAAALAALAGLSSTSAFAHGAKIGDLSIGHPHARATVPGQPAGAAYLSIENNGKTADRLVGVSSPVAAGGQIHTMSMEGSVMKMREVDAIAIAPGAKVSMKPGDGYHLMLTGLKKPLKEGDKFPLTLTFEKAGKLDVEVHVDGAAKAEPAMSGEHAAHQH